jgi:nicotinamidase-related amidase
MNTALIIIDIQNDYFPGGKMELEGSVAASFQAKRLLAHFRQVHLPIVFIQHISIRPNATFFLPQTNGVMIHENVIPLANEEVVQKHYPNSFRDTNLLDYLQRQQVKQLVLAGMMTHMCVDATVRAAFDYGFVCRIAQDACATRTLTFQGKTVPAEYVHQSFLAALDGTYGKVMTVDDLICQL